MVMEPYIVGFLDDQSIPGGVCSRPTNWLRTAHTHIAHMRQWDQDKEHAHYKPNTDLPWYHARLDSLHATMLGRLAHSVAANKTEWIGQPAIPQPVDCDTWPPFPLARNPFQTWTRHRFRGVFPEPVKQ